MNKFASSPVDVHWIGVDVAKMTFDAALARHGQKWPSTPMASVPVRTFARTREGVGEFLAWLDALTGGDDAPCAVRAVMEATGRYSTELAVWMTELRPFPVTGHRAAPPDGGIHQEYGAAQQDGQDGGPGAGFLRHRTPACRLHPGRRAGGPSA